MGGRAGGGASGGMGSKSRSGGLNIIDHAKQMSTSELLRMSEAGDLEGMLATKELTSRITIEKTDGLIFRNPANGKIYAFKDGGFAMKLGDAGYVGSSDGVWSTKKKILKDVVEKQGGLTKYKASEVYKPVGVVKNGKPVLFK